MSRIKQSACALSLLAGACNPAPFDRDANERAVLAAVLESSVGVSRDSAHIVLSPTFIGVLPDDLASRLSEDLVADLTAAARADSVRLPLPTAFRLSIDSTSARRRHVIDSLRREPLSRSGAGFEVVSTEYPGALAIFSLSHPGFSRDRRRAVLYMVINCGMLCAEGMLVELEHTGGQWRVLWKESLWVS